LGVTGLHVQPRLAVGDVSARQALILLELKNQMLRSGRHTTLIPPGENALAALPPSAYPGAILILIVARFSP
jgi:hypothetical protein